MLKTCKKLKTLHLRLTLSCVDVGGSGYAFSKPQYLHQEEPAVAKFRRTNGFDELLSLRGLENISVENSTDMSQDTLSDQEVLAFQTFLNQMLTQPEEPTVCFELNINDLRFHFILLLHAKISVGEENTPRFQEESPSSMSKKITSTVPRKGFRGYGIYFRE
jgi:hypothetical protein